MRIIYLNEGITEDPEDEKLIRQYKQMKLLQRTISYITGEEVPEKKNISSMLEMERDKVYLVKDFENNQYYYQLSDELYQDLKLNVEEYVNNLIIAISGLAEHKFTNKNSKLEPDSAEFFEFLFDDDDEELTREPIVIEEV